ncbi:MAG: hypothetical protein OEZ51_00300 [Nitrospinota bacterium]|nr:hypothetical protein [Nitrospinota bacterium]
MNTLGQLKLELLHRGVAFGKNVRSHDLVSPGLFPEGEGQAIVLSLAEDFFVRARVNPDKDTAFLIDVQKNKVSLNWGNTPLEIGVVPAPQFLKNPRAIRNPAAAFIQLDGYCLNLNLNLEADTRQLNLSLEDTISLVRAAFQEGAADLVLLNMSHCAEKDRGFSRLAPLVQSIKKNFRTFVALRGFPPDDLGVIDSFYAAGVDLISFPLEQYAEDGTVQDAISAKQGMKGLEYAAGVFGPGTVSTELALDCKHPQPLLEKITALSKQGIVPLIKFPEQGFHLQDDLQEVRKVVDHLHKTAQKEKLNLKWLYPAEGWISPLDTSFYLEKPAAARLAQRPVYQSTLGKTASEGFAALRRKLRIKNVSDSYESAGL